MGRRTITLYNAKIISKVLQEYNRRRAGAEYVVGASWKKDVARQVGAPYTGVICTITEFEEWLGNPLFDVIPSGSGTRSDNLYVITSWGVIVNDVLTRIFGDDYRTGLIPLLRHKINVFQGNSEAVPNSKNIVKMGDFVLVWQVGHGVGFPTMADYLSRRVNRRIQAVEAFLGVKLIKRRTSSKHHNWTEIGLFLSHELRKISEGWMEVVAIRGVEDEHGKSSSLS